MDYKKLQNGSDIRGVALEGIEGQHINLTETVCRDIGRGFALCSYGMELCGKELSAKDFPICMHGGKCLKEEAEKNKEVNAQ